MNCLSQANLDQLVSAASFLMGAAGIAIAAITFHYFFKMGAK